MCRMTLYLHDLVPSPARVRALCVCRWGRGTPAGNSRRQAGNRWRGLHCKKQYMRRACFSLVSPAAFLPSSSCLWFIEWVTLGGYY